MVQYIVLELVTNKSGVMLNTTYYVTGKKYGFMERLKSPFTPCQIFSVEHHSTSLGSIYPDTLLVHLPLFGEGKERFFVELSSHGVTDEIQLGCHANECGH